ncbi:ubiquitin fusion degradation protein [Paramarasmius palmivorus]|uniref:Ubiquitin fusion degradation protein n=1 Tax=Paramarasmius palmivorus TaxID=297713 RepID=A0AAW0DSI6_9AGAR
MSLFGNQGPGGLLSQFGFPAGYGQHMGPAPPRAFDEYLKAYSVGMMSGKPRENVSYGGKIIMPPSALATLTRLDLESPWMFQLRNPNNSAASTHAGVLEFIADEGVVHLPYWMMKTLKVGGRRPYPNHWRRTTKGKASEASATNSALLRNFGSQGSTRTGLRNFSALTQGDIVEISYNSIVFPLLIMETSPGNSGISVLDTDLEVDFAPPVGYVEPERPKAAPPVTMAEKLKIDLNSHSPGSSRPGSALSGGFAGASTGQTGVSKDGDHWEAFKGKGETLAGRKTKGKGITQRKVEGVAEGSKIIKTDNRRIVSNNTLETETKVPAALNLPFGKLFFGFNVATYVPPVANSPTSSPDLSRESAFSGSGATLNGQQISQPSSSSAKGKGKEKEPEASSSSWSGQGNTLGNSVPREVGLVGAGGARVPRLPQRQSTQQAQRERSPTPDFGVDDDDDVIMIDSD